MYTSNPNKSKFNMLKLLSLSLLCTAIITFAFVFAAPTFAFAEEKSGIQVLLPNMIEFIPMTIAFIIVAIILGKFGWPIFEEMLQSRSDKIKGDLEASEKAKIESENTLNEYKKKLDTASSEADKIIADAKNSGIQVKEKIESDAQIKSQDIIDKAKLSIQTEKKLAQEDIKEEAVDIAMNAVEHLIGDGLTDEQHKKLIVKYINQSGSLASNTK